MSVCPNYFGAACSRHLLFDILTFCFHVEWRIREGVFFIFFKFWFLGTGDRKKGNFFEKIVIFISFPFDLIFGTGIEVVP